MSPVQAIVLALVQAVTEFLPISSSGHLILIPHLLGWPDQGLSFDIATNTGTLLAVVAYFRRDLAEILRALAADPRAWRPEAAPAARLGWHLAIGTLPAVAVGLAIHGWVAQAGRDPLLVACNLIAYGLLLLWADRRARQERTEADLTWKTALLVGAAQSLALVPGTSRSGITLTALLLLGLTRPAAARYAFLLAVPVGILAEAKDLAGHLLGGAPPVLDGFAVPLLAVAVSAVAGYLVIAWLLAWLRRRSLAVFVAYRVAFGVALLAFALRG
ncbi:MAG TPA: undecaprenyl-diphosphate phosphatase [Thermoanaerobaculia bacterium]|nr:undecaprenyl-diphosphate phosphatase [Thermoanaerobaculia bacterium]